MLAASLMDLAMAMATAIYLIKTHVSLLEERACCHLDTATPTTNSHLARASRHGGVSIPLDPLLKRVPRNLETRVPLDKLCELPPQLARTDVATRLPAIHTETERVKEATAITRLSHHSGPLQNVLSAGLTHM
jgi:hypothetical protein